MTPKRITTFALLAAVVGALSLAGCTKKTARVTPLPPPAAIPTAPTVSLAANPSVIQQGQASVLTWQTANASEVTIAGLGMLPSSGSRSVMPGTSTTYSLIAKGPGGTNEASARVTIDDATARTTSSPSDEDLFSKNVKDVHFDYDKFTLRPADASTVQNDGTFLAQHQSISVVVEGHCDDRGSEEYNLALGASRAESVKKELVLEGIPAARIKTVSFGKEKPFCTEDNAQCWQQNRVDHFVVER